MGEGLNKEPLRDREGRCRPSEERVWRPEGGAAGRPGAGAQARLELRQGQVILWTRALQVMVKSLDLTFPL